MTSRAGENSLLQYKLFIRRRASATQGTPPGNDDLKWVANTTTLVYGEREALLVDTFLSDEQTAELAEWIAARKGVSQPSILRMGTRTIFWPETAA